MIDEIYKKTEEDMKIALSVLHDNLNTIRTGRINVSIFNSILVECYQKSVNINQLASISITNNNTAKIIPWDKNNIQNINKAIMNSKLGVNPSILDDTIKIIFPPMNEERRKELIKNMKKTG
jgi:ribosome recycling factor